MREGNGRGTGGGKEYTVGNGGFCQIRSACGIVMASTKMGGGDEAKEV